MRMRKTMLLVMVLVGSLIMVAPLAAQNNNDENTVVSVPKKYVSAEGLNHLADPTERASKWIGVGKEIGVATREGLGAVVDTAEKFGSTKVGTFVMVMIAWKIMARDVLGIVLGIPLLVGGLCIWVWGMKRLFFGYRVLAKQDGRVKTYEDHAPYHFTSSDARAGVGAFMYIGLAVWVSVMIFVVIF